MSDQSKQWVMAPVVPTQAMLDAVMENDKPADHWVRVTRYGMADAYSAMLAAAPKVEREGLMYRMLDTTDTIRADDEFIDDNCIDWNRPVGWEVGMRWTYTFKTARRGIAPAHGKQKEQDQ